MTLAAVAREAGVSKTTLSDLERGKGNPSVDTLWSLASALHVPVAFLFQEDDPGGAVRLLRLGDAPVMAAEGVNFVAQHMVSRRGSGEFEINIISLTAGARRYAKPHNPGLVEHAIPLDGRLEIGPDDQVFVLEPGDLLTFPADRPHHYHAIAGPVRAVVLHEYPATFAGGRLPPG
jgi:XRE family transcriptional regulator, regulator of sulfur utilization